jgi:hypothetical protein
MTDAPVPVSHPPVSYLNAGGSNFFSKNCQELLIKAGLNPDDFGSYEYVRDRNAQARTRCEEWDNATPQQRRARGLTEPTPEDRRLADSTASHLIQDGSHRNDRPPGSPEARRIVNDPGPPPQSRVIEDPCQNRVDGFVTSQAPSMPLQGHGGDPNSLEGMMGTMEQTQAARQRERNAAAMTDPANPNPPPSVDHYPANRMSRDADTRGEVILREHEARFGAQGAPTATGAGAAGAGNNAAAPIGARGPATAATPTEPNCPPEQVVDGETAAECVNNWRKKAEAEMKTSGVDGEIARLDAQAANAPAVAQVQAARQASTAADQQATAARQQLQQTQQDRATAQELADDAERRRDAALRGRPPNLDAARAAEGQRQQALAMRPTDAQLAADTAARDAAAANQQVANQNLERTEARLGAPDLAQQHADCLRQQRARIQAGNPRVDGRAVAPPNAEF